VVKSRCRLRKALPLFDEPSLGQVDRFRHPSREEERLGAPGSASATPARQRDRQRPSHVEGRRAKAVEKPFGAHRVVSSAELRGFLERASAQEAGSDLDDKDGPVGRSVIGPLLA
jgi:hypothetical protein